MSEILSLIEAHSPDQNKVALSNGWSVKEKFYHHIFNTIKLFIPYMVPGHLYLLETMFREEQWDSMSVWERIQAGWVISHIANMGLLEIFKAPTRNRTLRFKRK